MMLFSGRISKFIFAFVVLPLSVRCQQFETIAFHLYTDSLKKGTYNYINVDGKASNGKWFPLGPHELDFQTSTGSFIGNNLLIPLTDTALYADINVTMRKSPFLSGTTRIWIKKKEEDEKLMNNDEYLNQLRKSKKSKKNAGQ